MAASCILVVNRLVIFVSEITGKQRTRRLLRNNFSAPEFSKRFCYGNNIFDDKNKL